MKYVTYLLFVLLICVTGQSAHSAPAGELDPTFADGGIRSIPFNRGGNHSDRAWAATTAPDGRIYLAGPVARSAQTVGIGIARLFPDGQLDESYLDGMGTPGRVSYLPVGYSRTVPRAALTLENGTLIVAGSATPTGTSDSHLMVCMFDKNGAIVSGFGPAPEDGCGMFDVGATGEATFTGMVLDSQGNLALSGYVRIGGADQALLARMYRSGELIPTFGSGGIRYPQFPEWATQTRFNAISMSPDSRLVAVGSVDYDGIDDDFIVAKFNWVTGSFDQTFSGGFKRIAYDLVFLGENNDAATAVHVLDDASIIVAGNAQGNNGYHRPAAAKLTSVGEIVYGWGGSQVGKPTYMPCDFCDKRVSSISTLQDGKIALGGQVGIAGLLSSNDLFAMLLNADGTRDQTFGSDAVDPGTARIDIGGNEDGGVDLVIQGDRILVAGYGHSPGIGNDDFMLVRLDHGLEGPNYNYTVTPDVVGVNGTVFPDVPQFVGHSGYKVFTITPDDGFAIKEIQGTCLGSLIDHQYYVGPVTNNCQFQVSFVKEVTLTYNAGEHGTLTHGNQQGLSQVVQSIPLGGDGTSVWAVPDEGFEFFMWSDGDNVNPRADTNVMENIELTAKFIPIGGLQVIGIHNDGGEMLPADEVYVSPGDSVQFTVLPFPGFAIGTIAGSCGGSLAGQVYTTNPVTQYCAVQVTFVPSDEEFLLSYTAGQNGLVNGEELLQQNVIAGGTGPQVTAQPDPGYFFVKWSDGWAEAERQDANVVGDIDVTAEFAADGTDIFLVTPSWQGGGSMLPGAPLDVVEGGQAVFTISPNPGFAIDSVGGSCGGSLQGAIYTTLAVTENCTVEAIFVPSDEQFQLTYLHGPNGYIEGDVDQVVPAGGTSEQVTAVAEEGYFFVKWSDFPAWLGAERVDSNVTGDITVTATFAADGTSTYLVLGTFDENGGGTVSPEEHLAIEGENVLFTIKPDPGFVIDQVTGCDGSLVGNQYLTAPVTADCDVHATFLPSDGQEFTLTYTAGQGGTVNDQLFVDDTVPAGGDGDEVEAKPDVGFFFVQWSDGVTNNLRQDTHVAGDINVTAEFAPNGTTIHTVTPSSTLGGVLVPMVPLEIADGASVQFQVQSNEGYTGVEVGGTCGGSLEGNLYTTNPIIADCTVEATFSDRLFYNGFGFGDEQE